MRPSTGKGWATIEWDLFMRVTVFAAILATTLVPLSAVWAQSPGNNSSPAPDSPHTGPAATTELSQPSPAPIQPAEITRQLPVSSIVEKDLVAPDGSSLGDIEQVVEQSSDKVMYLVVSNGGIMGFFDNQVVVPLSKIAVRNDRIVAPDLTEETLKSLPDFEEDAFQNVGVGRTVTIAELK
ncbi:PRC-barrel domain-containing protein [Microvirga arabica]|uniref:PRC-barrel domain-containing protein n=1 Tax=Microvirga arabica TaxID=1128671 RepID=UPI001939472E|nr:PRC-barrel domain-containing protein [Microvirga arabica]MBM1170051.1 PRC-barrel domain-containing protein [Microvirga arabica]